jgi:hypothetical protein
MNEHAEQLRETFEAHEKLAPHPAAVYARVEELARTYRRRRRGAQAVGGAVLGAGLVAGGVNVSGLLAGDSKAVIVQAASTPAPVVTTPAPVVTTPSQAEIDSDVAVFINAGYGLEDARQLARIWKTKDDLTTVKAEAGRRILAGEKLPIKPSSPVTPADKKETARVDAFFEAGYDYYDAVKLGELWKTASPYQAKVEGGKRLLAGQTLPIQP